MPAAEIESLHVQRCQKSGTLRVLPGPEVAVLDMAHQIGQGGVGQKKVPGQPGARFFQIEIHQATAAVKTLQTIGRTFVVVKQHQLSRARLDRSQQLAPK